MSDSTPTPPATPSAIARTVETQSQSPSGGQTQTVTTSTTKKPGWETSEFWAMLAVKIPGALMALGLVGAADIATRIVGAAMMVLSFLGYAWARTLVKTAAVFTVLIFLPLNTGCGPNNRQIAVSYSLATLDTAASAFTSYDALHQQDIVEKSASREEGTKQLQEWRDRRTVAVYTISAAYRAVALVATDSKQPLQILVSAVALVKDTLTQLGVKL